MLSIQPSGFCGIFFSGEQASCRFPVLSAYDFIAVNAEKMNLRCANSTCRSDDEEMFQAKGRYARLTAGLLNPSICSLLSIGVCFKDKAFTTGLDSTPTIRNYPMSQDLLNLASYSFQCLHLFFSHHKIGLGISIALCLAFRSAKYSQCTSWRSRRSFVFSRDSNEQH